MYPYSSLCYILDLFCYLVLVPWGAMSKVLSITILTYHVEHGVSYVLTMPNTLTHTLGFFCMGGSLACLVLKTSWAENLVSTEVQLPDATTILQIIKFQ
jgi:hypothetical protein